MTNIKDQPKPTSNSRPAVWDLVINDMQERDALGRHRYGTPLQPFNGRDALVDAYQEALDLAVYLRQAIEERNAVQPPVTQKVPERKTCERCGKHVGQNDWDIHTCTPPELKRPQPVRREKEVIHKEMGTLSWLDEDEFVGYWMKTTGRTRDLYAEPPKQKCWLCGDMDPTFQAKCNVPACGMKEQPAQPAQPQQEPLPNGLTEAETSATAFVAGLLRKPAQPQQEPLFWYRPCSNGMYEGPIHNAQIERVRKESGAWFPLYTSPPARKPLTNFEGLKLACKHHWLTIINGQRVGGLAGLEAAHGIKGDA